MKIVADRMDVNVHEVIRAAATKPFGFTPYYPGPGLGGHCIPIDPFYLTWKAREYGLHTRFIELAGEVNTNMPRWVISKTMDALNDRGKSFKGAKILVLGIAYKKNIDDMRESPALVLIELLEHAGAQVAFHDPHVPIIPITREHSGLAGRRSSDLDVASSADAVLIVTDHDEINYEFLAAEAALIIDTRNAMRNSKDRDNIVKA